MTRPNAHTQGAWIDDDATIEIDPEGLISHTLIQANSGGGKTHLERRILEQVHTAAPELPLWVIDPEGEMHTLRERLPLIYAAPDSKECVATVKTAATVARRLLETGASAVIDIYDLGVNKDAFIEAFVMGLMDAPRHHWRDVLLCIDEASRFAPERGEGDARSTEAIRYLLTNGRKRGYATLLATQRLATLHKSVAAECNNRLIGRTGLDVDQARACKALGWKSNLGPTLANLDPGDFWVYGPALCRTPQLVHCGKVVTSHGAAARGKAVTPPLEEARRILAAIGEMPAEAELEALTSDQLRARVTGLQAELAKERSKVVAVTDTGRERLEQALKAAYAERDEGRVRNKALDDKLTHVKAAYRRQHEAFSRATPIIEKIRNLAVELEQTIEVERLPWSEVDASRPGIAVVTQYTAGPPPDGRPLSEHLDELAKGSQPNMPAIQRALLTVLAQRGRLSKGKVLLHAGYARSGSTSDAWAELTRLGWITSEAGEVAITDLGRGALGRFEPLPTGRALLESVLAKLDKLPRALLKTVAQFYPQGLSKGAALEITGYARSGSTSDAWAYLTARDYITTHRGVVVAAKELCEP